MKPKPKEFFVLAHNIRSLLNVGSIFRTADGFGVSKLYLTGYTGTPENPIHRNKIAKVALGAEAYVPWEYRKSPLRLIRSLKKTHRKLTVLALENNTKARLLQKYKPKFPLLLILGEEVKGIDKKLLSVCDQVVEIPMLGRKESLNVSTAFGIAAYALVTGYAAK